MWSPSHGWLVWLGGFFGTIAFCFFWKIWQQKYGDKNHQDYTVGEDD